MCPNYCCIDCKQSRPWSDASDLSVHCLQRPVFPILRIILVLKCTQNFFHLTHDLFPIFPWNIWTALWENVPSDPTETQIGLHIMAVWSALLSAWRNFATLAMQNVHSDQILWMLRHTCSPTTNIRCGYSLEAPLRGASNEYPQHTFSWRNKKIIITFLLKKKCLIWNYVDLPWMKMSGGTSFGVAAETYWRTVMAFVSWKNIFI